jgi:hypothetical protein
MHAEVWWKSCSTATMVHHLPMTSVDIAPICPGTCNPFPAHSTKHSDKGFTGARQIGTIHQGFSLAFWASIFMLAHEGRLHEAVHNHIHAFDAVISTT